MRNWMTGAVTAALFWAQAGLAQQDVVYIQVEARPSLTGGQDGARDYAQRFDNVAGFALGGGWYGVALGPYSRDQAQQELARLRSARVVPADSFIEEAEDYGRQFWPVGAQAARTETATAGADIAQAESGAPLPQAPQVDPVPDPQLAALPEETPREARASEAQLTRAEKEELQIALQWADYYRGAIDAAFGRGTRGAMADWQRDNGFEVTGVLTTRQRAVLLQQYYAVLEGLDMTRVVDARTGIAVELPLGVLAFDRYEAPFALFEPTSDDPRVRALLISQPGDRGTLGGLYEILQTLEIVPLDGPRERNRDGFTLVGENARIVSHTEVTLRDGAIKGFMLVWPAGDEERRQRVLGLMQASFERIDGVLDPADVTDEGQAVDLVSGLEIRQPKATASGFFVSEGGLVATSAAAVQGCTRITLNEIYEAELATVDSDLGVAVLRPLDALAPRGVASLMNGTPRLQAEVAVAGYPFGGVLSAPTLTFGTLQDLQGLRGEEALKRLAMVVQPGDAGGPVLDAGGAVLGMLLPAAGGSGQVLPDGVSFAVDAQRISDLVALAGGAAPRAQGGGIMAPEDLTSRAADMTVLVRCWE